MYPKINNENIFSMKVDDVRATGTGGKLDTDTLKQSDLYLGIKFSRHHLYISPYGGLMPMIVSKWPLQWTQSPAFKKTN